MATFRFRLIEPQDMPNAEIDVRGGDGGRLDHVSGDRWSFEAQDDERIFVAGGVASLPSRDHLASGQLGMHRFYVSGEEGDRVTFESTTSAGVLTFVGIGLRETPRGT